jgi:hypothetical protein
MATIVEKELHRIALQLQDLNKTMRIILDVLEKINDQANVEKEEV